MRAQKTLTSSYLSAFCFEISLFLRAGMTISDGLLILRDDDNDKASKKLMSLLYDLTEEGAPLSGALKEAGIFPRYMLDVTALAEKTGKLEDTMRGLSDYYDRQGKLALSIKNAVFYPIVLIVIMMAVIAVLVVQVLPIFNDVFNQMGMRMSAFAVEIMALGQAMSRGSVAIGIVSAISLSLIFLVFRIPSFNSGFFSFVKNNFGDKGIFKRISSARFAFAMSMAASSGINVGDAISLAAKVCDGGRAFTAKSQNCKKLFEGGMRLGDAFSFSGIFTSGNNRMISLAEQAGSLPDALEMIAQRSAERVNDELDSLVAKIEPTLVIITSLIVGLILMSVMLPLMGIMSAIR